MRVEAANILRRAVLAGQTADDIAAMAFGDLLDLPVELFPFAPLVTPDRALAGAPGARCSLEIPPG